MAKYYVTYETGETRTKFARTILKEFNTKTDALKFAYQKARNFRSNVNVGRSDVLGHYIGQVICIKNKRFYIAFNRNKNAISPYGREYVLHSDGTLGE